MINQAGRKTEVFLFEQGTTRGHQRHRDWAFWHAKQARTNPMSVRLRDCKIAEFNYTEAVSS